MLIGVVEQHVQQPPAMAADDVAEFRRDSAEFLEERNRKWRAGVFHVYAGDFSAALITESTHHELTSPKVPIAVVIDSLGATMME